MSELQVRRPTLGDLLAAEICPICRDDLSSFGVDHARRCGECDAGYHLACLNELAAGCAVYGCQGNPGRPRWAGRKRHWQWAGVVVANVVAALGVGVVRRDRAAASRAVDPSVGSLVRSPNQGEEPWRDDLASELLGLGTGTRPAGVDSHWLRPCGHEPLACPFDMAHWCSPLSLRPPDEDWSSVVHEWHIDQEDQELASRQAGAGDQSVLVWAR